MKNRITKSAVKTIVLVILCVMSVNAYSQERFNRIINLDREANHLLVSLTPTNDGYVIVCGTDDAELFNNNRCSIVAILDNSGECLAKTLVGDDFADTYEGWYNQKMIITEDNTYKYVFDVRHTGLKVCEFSETLEVIDSVLIYFANDSTLVNAQTFGFANVNNYIYVIENIKIDTLNSQFYHPIMLKIDNDNVSRKYMYIDNDIHQYTGIIKAHDNGLILLGDIYGNHDWLVSQVDEDGNLIWYKTYGRTGWNNGMYKFIAPSPDSSYVMSGMYPVCYANYFQDEPSTASCLRKIDDSGNLQWEKIIKNYSDYNGIDFIQATYGVYVDDQGYIYVIGTGRGAVSIGGFLLKLSPRGDIMYRRDYLPMGIVTRFENYLTSIKPTPDGGFILGGYTYDDYFGELFNDYYQQPWLVKTDHDGLDGLCYTELPELTLDVFIPDTVCNMDTIDCVVNISGPSAPYTLEFGTGQVIDSIYYPDIFVPSEIGIDTEFTGNRMYQYTEYITEATLKDTAENIIARHYNIATPTLPGEQQLAITLTDYYGNTKTIYKDIYVNTCHEVEVDENENVMLSVYPNPATEYINIAGENIAGIEICNLLGGVVYETQQCNGNNVISMDGMGAGSYFVRITMEDGKVVTKKIVVVR